MRDGVSRRRQSAGQGPWPQWSFLSRRRSKYELIPSNLFPPVIHRLRNVFSAPYIQIEKIRSTFSTAFRNQERFFQTSRSTGALRVMIRSISCRISAMAGAP